MPGLKRDPGCEDTCLGMYSFGQLRFVPNGVCVYFKIRIPWIINSSVFLRHLILFIIGFIYKNKLEISYYDSVILFSNSVLFRGRSGLRKVLSAIVNLRYWTGPWRTEPQSGTREIVALTWFHETGSRDLHFEFMHLTLQFSCVYPTLLILMFKKGVTWSLERQYLSWTKVN